jgi:hypothetical protein
MANSKIRQSAKGEECSLRVSDSCTDEYGSVVACHLNSNYRGVGIKSPDLFVVYACFFCHQLLDKSEVSAEDQLRASQETQMKLLNKGLINI